MTRTLAARPSRLPRHDAFSARPVRHADRRVADAAAGRLRVLVLDAGEDSADSMATLLRAFGHRADTEASGAAGVRAAAVRQPDVVVYDLNLPDLTGAVLAARLGWVSDGWRPLLVSVGCTLAPRPKDAGADVYLLKPADPVELGALLASYARLCVRFGRCG